MRTERKCSVARARGTRAVGGPGKANQSYIRLPAISLAVLEYTANCPQARVGYLQPCWGERQYRRM